MGRVNSYFDTLYYKYKHSTTGLKITEEKDKKQPEYS